MGLPKCCTMATHALGTLPRLPSCSRNASQVHFDPAASSTAASCAPAVLCCSDDGAVYHCTFASSSSSALNDPAREHGGVSSSFAAPGKQGTHKPLFSRPYSVNSMDVESNRGMDVVAVTEGQEVVYFRR